MIVTVGILVGLLWIGASPVAAAPPAAAEAWMDEARADPVPDAVRDAAVAYGGGEVTEILTEGTMSRYPYGHRQPVLVCAPLRICSIVLEAGETVLDVVSGDVVHWQTFDLSTGPGGTTPVVGVRPMVDFEAAETCDKTTSLLITTDRRIYDILLELLPCGELEAEDPNPQRSYQRQISFYYPDDLIERWTTRAALRLAREAEQSIKPAGTVLAATVGIDDLHWDYREVEKGRWLKGRPRFPWRPTAVFDDGERTYLRMPPEMRALPAVFEVREGKDVVVNFRVDSEDRQLMIVPGVAEHLVLVLPGRGGKQARLDLLREVGR